MKVLLVLDIFSSRGGGVASVVLKLANALTQSGHSVSIWCTDLYVDKDFSSQLDPKIRIKYFKTVLKLGGLTFAPSAFFCAKEIAEFDVLHIHSFTSFINIPIYTAALKKNIPIILDCHGNLPLTDDKLKKKLFFNLFGKKMFQKTSLFIAETELGKSEYIKLGALESKVVVQHPGFDLSDYNTLPNKGIFRSKMGISPGEKIIFFLGRLHKIKGIDFLIKAFAEASAKNQTWKLVIAGPDDGYLSEINDLLSQYDIKERVMMHGYMGHGEKMEALVDADLFAQPSRYEQGIAHTSIEALLCGLPIVATEGNGAAEDFKKMQCAELVGFGDTKMMIKKFEQLLTHPEEGELLCKNGKRYLYKNLDLPMTAKRFEEFYAGVADGKL